MDRIFHIAEANKWEEAQSVGLYRHSTLGKTLDDVGFIHCSRADQVQDVANTIYHGRSGLVLLIIDPARVSAEIRQESVGGGTDVFPHIYGPLNLDAVVEVLPFEPEH